MARVLVSCLTEALNLRRAGLSTKLRTAFRGSQSSRDGVDSKHGEDELSARRSAVRVRGWDTAEEALRNIRGRERRELVGSWHKRPTATHLLDS